MNEDEEIREELKETIDRMAPDREQRGRIWDHIEAKIDSAGGSDSMHTEKLHVRKRRITINRITAIAAALVLAVTGVTMHYRVNDNVDVPAAIGYVYAAENRITDMTPHEILVLAGDPTSNDGENEVYAPQIYYLDSSRLIFGNAYGLVIYDRVNKKTEGLIDLQAICSAYYNCDTVKTHVTVNDDRLVIYNTKGDYTNYGLSDEESGRDTTENAWGYYHIYDLGALPGDASFAECTESGEFDTTDCDMYREGSKFEKEHYVDAWDNVRYLQTSEVDDAIGQDGGSYSENAYVYTDSEGDKHRCVLLFMSSKDDVYTLVCENAKTGEIAAGKLETGVTGGIRKEVQKLCSLLPYEYTGDDPVMKAICEDISKSEDVDEGGVLVPEPNIYGKAEEGDELLVFGDFFRDTYVKRGNTLVCVSGGSYPGCYHLKRSKSGDGSYVVSSVDIAEDGEGYIDSIKKLTKGHPVIRSRFMKASGFDEAVRKEYIKMYVESGGAGIEYYKDYGWDPIRL